MEDYKYYTELSNVQMEAHAVMWGSHIQEVLQLLIPGTIYSLTVPHIP